MKALGFIALDVIQLTEQIETKHDVVFGEGDLLLLRDSVIVADIIIIIANIGTRNFAYTDFSATADLF